MVQKLSQTITDLVTDLRVSKGIEGGDLELEIFQAVEFYNKRWHKSIKCSPEEAFNQKSS